MIEINRDNQMLDKLYHNYLKTILMTKNNLVSVIAMEMQKNN